MWQSCRAVRFGIRLGALIITAALGRPSAPAQIRDGGIDPWNLGKGDWIYVMSYATNKLGGNVASVTNENSLMLYYKSQGVRHVIVKAATGDQLYNGTYGSAQFTTKVVNAAHANGLLIFGYNRSYATNTAGEVAMADYVFNQGADGFVWDAEAEWESSRIGSQGPALAIAQCSAVRSNWPNKFLAHSPLPIISYHSSFPYKEFGYYCDTVMPQDYWQSIGVTPSYMVTWMDNEWRAWQNGLSGIWVNSIKPVAPAGQGWSPSSSEITTEAEVAEFVNALKNDSSPVTRGGYRGVNYWRADLHTADIWSGIGANNIGGPYTSAPAISSVGAVNLSDISATVSWSTDQNSDAVVEYGTTTAYGSFLSNAISGADHTMVLTNLTPATTYHYRVKSRNPSNLQSTSADFTFPTNPSGVVNDIILDNTDATVNGSWVTGTSSTDKYGADYRFKSHGTGAAYLDYFPTIVTAGNYKIYEWHPQGSNRTTDAPYTIHYNGGSQVITVNQTANGGSWNLLGTFNFAAGSAGYVRIADTFTSGLPGASGTNVMADAIKLAYVPPVLPPAITAQPQAQTVTAGASAAFTVTAAGTAPLKYQWRFGGTNIPGATGNSYTRTNAQPGFAGDYYVVVTNFAGTNTSSNALLSVILPPVITGQPQSQTARVGTNATFTVTATGTAPLSYQWLFNDANIYGANASAYTRTAAQSADAGAYAVLVGNTAGSVTSAIASLTLALPTPPGFQSIAQLLDRSVSLVITGDPGACSLETSSNLADWSLLMNLVNTNGTLNVTDNSATNVPQRFYRTKQ